MNLTQKIIGYHYTSARAYASMQTKGIEGFITPCFDDFAGLIPSRRFIRLGGAKRLPNEAHQGVIEGLLEPEPRSWTRNDAFPHFWRYLMHDICRTNEVVLLRFELRPEDEAYVVDRAHIERELYRESMGRGTSTPATRSRACRNYWNSRVPVYAYDGNYAAPQLAIWSGIAYDRLEVVWKKPTEQVWKRVLKNKW